MCDMDLLEQARRKTYIYKVLNDRKKISERSVNFTSSQSDLKVQIQTDSRYQKFLSRASAKVVLGYKMNIASVPIWGSGSFRTFMTLPGLGFIPAIYTLTPDP
jgi:hypothetical protein